MPGIRDLGMLKSAVYSDMQSFSDKAVYPTPIERAARLAYSATMNHPFIAAVIIKTSWRKPVKSCGCANLS